MTYKKPHKRVLGLLAGKIVVPDDIDFCNDEIAEMFDAAIKSSEKELEEGKHSIDARKALAELKKKNFD
ncbi:MAG: hypothetical protein J5928_01425 [Firmicutes bacterium]|nr:hypothetical protein [Bacillota bacterium]